ncbi:ATP-binding protein [Thermodesulfobacteriota bacterium]
MLEAAGQMFWELDKDYTVIHANKLLVGVFGNPVGKRCFEFMAGRTGPCRGCPVEEVFMGAERAVSERLRKTKSGQDIWLQHTALPIRDQEGQLVGASELMTDTTQRKEMEGWLRDSERLYRNLVEQVPDVIFSLDATGRFVFVNTQVEALLGFPVKEVLETRLSDYVTEEDRAQLEDIFRLGPEAIWDEEVGLIDAARNKKFARIRCKASFENGERPSGFDGVLRDRTTRRQLEEELKASREALVEKIRIIDELYEHIVQSGKCKAIEEHTAEVAHELRQPLAIVGGFARRIAKQMVSGIPSDMEKLQQYVNIIITEIQRLEKILDRLIDFTKREEVHLQRVNPNGLIEYILGIAEGRIKDKGVRVVKNLGPEIGDMFLDPGRFQQLVLNLISNAVDACPSSGSIVIETGASIPSDKALKAGQLDSETYFELKIRNNGPVIPPEALKQIFNPFYTTKEHGTGLGLPVSKKIVEDHSGTISVKSDDESTSFTVWLPVNQRDDSPFDPRVLLKSS